MGLLLSVQIKVGEYGFGLLKFIMNFLPAFYHTNTL